MMADYSYKYFPRQLKQAVDEFDTTHFDYLIKKEAWGQLSLIYDSLAKINSEGCPLSDDQKTVLNYPFELWGRDAVKVLNEIRKVYWEERKTQKK